MAEKHYIIYYGGKRFNSMNSGGTKFSIGVDENSEKPRSYYDAIAIAAVNSINRFGVDPRGPYMGSNSTLVVTFTPITDPDLLQYIDEGKTIIRVQLLLDGRSRIKHCMHSHSNVDGMIKPRSSQRAYEGIAWKNLTSNELRAGTCTLNYGAIPDDDHEQVKDAHKNVLQATKLYDGYDESDPDWPYYEIDPVYKYIGAEIYVPAYGKGTSHMFQYEKDGNRIYDYTAVNI